MAKDYNQVLLDKWYSQEQIDAMVWAVNSGQNANDVVQNYTPTTPSSSSSSSSSNSGGNYVYNPVTEYYELQNDGGTQTTTSSSWWSADWYTNATARNMATGGSEFWRNNQTSNTTQQTTQTQNTQQPKQQTQTVGSTVVENQQQGVMKPLSQEYYNQTSDNALNTIRNNLNNYRQTNPEYFTDYDTFKRNFSYDSRNDEQKNLLDTWYNWYQSQLQLSSVPTTDLYTQYKDGQLSAADLEGLRISNPEKYAELQNQINKGNIIAAYDDDKGADTTGMSIQDMAYNMAMQTFTKFMNWETSSAASNIFREYEEKMESPEMLSLADQTTEVQEQIENIQSDLDSIKKSVEAEYAWTWASRSKINAIIADRSYDLQLQLRTLNSEYNKYATQYNNRMQQYQNEFSMQLQEYQINQQERNQQMQELGFALDLMNFETNDQKAQREWDYWVKQQEYQNGNINSKDYQTRYKAALTSVQNLLSQYPGIPMVRSAEQMAQDVLKAIDSWSDLGAELTKINKQIQGKPEYKYMYNQTFRPATSSGFWTSMSIWGTDYVEYNGKLYTADEFNKQFGWAAGPTQTTNWWVSYDPVNPYKLQGALADYMNANKSGSNGGQCGKFVNDYLQSLWLWRLYGNSIASKTNTINVDAKDINNLSVWSVAVFDYSNVSSVSDNAKKYGHVAIVSEIDYQRGRVKLLESNLKGDEKVVSTRWVDINSPVLKWYFDPSKWAVVAGTTTVATNGDTGFVSWSIEGVPLAYERAVKNLVPAALQNSDKEREALDKIISNSYNWGIPQSEIALTYMGFDVSNADDKNLALNLVNTTRTLSSDTQEWIVQTISDLMNQGNYTQAIQTVENAVSQQAKAAWNYVPESSVKNAINKSNDLYNTIKSLSKSPTWVVSWTIESRLGKYASKEAKNIQSKLSLLQNSLDIKDADTAKRIIPQLTDTPDVFMSKLENLWNNAMTELNNRRTIYGLPALTVDALSNYWNRVALYRNWWTTSTGYSIGWGFNIQNTNFYQQYANTAAGVGSTVQLSWGYTVNWN